MHFVERYRARTSAALVGQTRTRVIDKNPPHRLGGDAEKLRSIFPVGSSLIHQTQICFIYESGRLKRVTYCLPSHCACGSSMQLVVNQRQKLIGRFAVSIPPFSQQSRYVGALRRRMCHAKER